uniref:Reverse transcriptase Ty1/copia-type domain-containing protein n=1 Tax=Fagus sylvatica TaxID=28930 RepID=A0A2N9HVF5_FAGSY
MVSEPTIMDPVANNPSPLLLLNNMSNLMSIKLDSMNYMLWKLQISAILDAYSMIEHLDGSTQQPRQFIVNEDGDQTLNPAFLIWRKKDKALLTLLLSTLSSPVLAMVVGTTTAQEVWNRLEEKFTCTARANVLNLKLELQGIKKGNDSINSYLQRIKNTKDKLSAVGVLVDNEELLHMVLKGLPKEFSSFASAIRTRDDTISFEKLSVLLQTEEQSMAAVSDPFPNSALAMFVSNNQKPHNGFNGGFTGNQGYNRGRGGRYSSNRGRGGRSFGPNPSYPSYPNPQMPQSSTPQPSSQFNPQGRTERPTCQICWKIGHYAVDCYQLIATIGWTLPIKERTHLPNLQPWPVLQISNILKVLRLGSLIQELLTTSHPMHPTYPLQHLTKVLSRIYLRGDSFYKGLSKDGVYPIHSSQFCSSASPKSAYLTSSSALKWQLWHSRLGHPSAKVIHVLILHLIEFIHQDMFCFMKPFFLVSTTSDQSDPSPQITPFSPDTWLTTLHTLHCCAQNQASIHTGLDSIPETLHTATPQHLLHPYQTNLSLLFFTPLTKCICLPDSRVTAPYTSYHMYPMYPMYLSPPYYPMYPTCYLFLHKLPYYPIHTNVTTPNASTPNPPQTHLKSEPHNIYKPKPAQHSSWCTAMEEEFAALQKQGTCQVQSLDLWPKASINNKELTMMKPSALWLNPPLSDSFSPWQCHSTGPLKQLDVKNAFLHGTLKEEVYMAQPPGYVDSTNSHYVCKLHKSIYGLKQAPRAWFDSFTTQLLHLGFTASTADSSLFIYHYKGVIAYLLLYVDDIVLTSNSTPFLDHLILQLSQVFDIKDLGTLHYFLGIQVVRTSENLLLTQTKYASDLLLKHHMVDSKPAKTPCSPNTRLSLHEGDVLSDPHGYRSLVGALHYLTFTRPDISFAVHQVCQYMSTPTSTHLTAAKRILRYIKGTLHHGIAFTPGPLSLSVYSDADWAAKKQPTVSRSSTESEYRALATASAEVCWIRTLLKELGIYLSQPPTLWCDNVSALAIASNPVFHARTKHIEVDFHFIWERVLHKDLVVKFVSTIDQLADIFTKSLPTQRFLDLQRNLTVSVRPHSIEGG